MESIKRKGDVSRLLLVPPVLAERLTIVAESSTLSWATRRRKTEVAINREGVGGYKQKKGSIKLE